MYAAVVVVSNLTADLLVMQLDPRRRDADADTSDVSRNRVSA
jgi:hypothetical protein